MNCQSIKSSHNKDMECQRLPTYSIKDTAMTRVILIKENHFMQDKKLLYHAKWISL